METSHLILQKFQIPLITILLILQIVYQKIYLDGQNLL